MLALARHGRGQMKHAIKAALKQCALLQHGASMAFDTRVCQQISWRREQVGNVQLCDFVSVELALLENFAGQACA